VTTRLRSDLALLLVTLVWGSTFVLMQNSVRAMPPFQFLTLRFALASLAMLALFGRRISRASRWDVLAGAGVGSFLFAGYAFQTVGLQYTTAARSGFLTGLTVVLVPVAGLLVLRHRPAAAVWGGVGVALLGLFLLSWPGWTGTDPTILYGDLITLACTVAFSLQIVLVGRYAPRVDPMTLTTAQLVMVTALSAAFSLNEPAAVAIPLWLWGNAIFMGVAATALAFGVQARAQRLTTATHTALILAMEPVFSALFAWLLTGEVLTGRSLVGCGLILAGMVIAEAGS
jgi:drug/metabolite transporter (DMT)-like permease